MNQKQNLINSQILDVLSILPDKTCEMNQKKHPDFTIFS